MPLMNAGLMMDMAPSGPVAPEVVARVTRLIEGEPALPMAAQLALNGVNGKSFALNEPGFTAGRGDVLRWRVSEGDDKIAASGTQSWLPVPHPVRERPAAAAASRWLEGHRADHECQRQ